MWALPWWVVCLLSLGRLCVCALLHLLLPCVHWLVYDGCYWNRSCLPDKLGCRMQKVLSPMPEPSRRPLTDQLLLWGVEAAVDECCSQPVSTYLQVCCTDLGHFPNKSSIWTLNPLTLICQLCSVLKATYPHSKRMTSHQKCRVIRSFDPQRAQCGSRFFKATP